MGKIYQILPLLVIITMTTSCGGSVKPQTPRIMGRAIVGTEVQKQDTIRLGMISEGEVIEGVFAVQNNTNTTITIGSIITSCGCSTTRYDNQPIEANKEKLVEFRFDSQGQRGWQIKNIDIVTTDHKTARVYLEADVTSPNN